MSMGGRCFIGVSMPDSRRGKRHEVYDCEKVFRIESMI